MRVAPYVLAAALTGTMAGCGRSADLDTHPIREPEYGYVTPYGYSPSRSSSSYSSSGRSTSKWDFYRNYRGNLHPGPESYP
jgi:hypothetical protein